ncbi:MAG: glycolate oxidase binding subunit [Frankiaceae bacterium]|jgi:glycolate oxidase FAD binding subunit|nr:glycolate oxidase binding subunit [Frankiaceae bacterium]
MALVTPGTVDELADALRDTAPSTVAVCGAGTAGVCSEPADVVFSTLALDRVVEHAPGDFVVTVQAGARLRDVQSALAASGQWLALDPPEADATIGGVVATAASGPRRLRYGTPRDLLIGVTVVLADGTIARSGGKVVKNVAGYDLGKLFCGAFGTLGVVAECTFRLHPRSRALRCVSVIVDDPGDVVRVLRRSPLRPSAIEYDGARLSVVAEGIDAVRDLIGGEVSDGLPEGFGVRPWQVGEVGLKATFRLGALSPAIALVRRVGPQLRLSAHAASGVMWIGGAVDAAMLAELRAGFAEYEGTVVVVAGPDAFRREVDVWGPVRGVEVMRRIRDRFDPDRRMNPGVFDAI